MKTTTTSLLLFSLLQGFLSIGSSQASELVDSRDAPQSGFLRKAQIADSRKLSSGLMQLLEEVALEGTDHSLGYHAQAFTWLKDSSNPDLTDEQIIQRYVLACIYFSTNSVRTAYTDAEYGVGAHPSGWINNSSWLTTTDECMWHGITCNDNGNIEKIDLSSNGLTGRFPPEVSLLSDYLLSLDISDNLVNNIGPLWTSFLGDLINLQYLYIGSTNFDYDGIPPEIGDLSNLIEFDCSYTLFFGPLNGTMFSRMYNLQTLVLSGNEYNSSVPDEIATLPQLQHLFIDDAFLEGDLAFVEKMPKIAELYLDFNQGLTGSIPASIGAASTLETLSVASCGLTGPIPSEMGLLHSLKNLILYGNKLDGNTGIPHEIGHLYKLESFEVEMNDIRGPMPDSVCRLTFPDQGGSLTILEADCNDDVQCSCCTACFGETSAPNPTTDG